MNKGIKMPVVGIYVSPINPEIGPKFTNEYYDIAYGELVSKIISAGGKPVLVYSAETTYRGDGTFSEYWGAKLESEKLVYELHQSEIKVDILYDKARFPFADTKTVNAPGLRDITANKYLSYLFTPDYHSSTFLISSAEELAVLKLGWAREKDQRVAIKELDSNSGDKVYVGIFADYDDSLTFPLIVQAFIDTSSGYDGLVEGMHDVRVSIYNGQVIHGLIRTPGDGTLKSNMQYGGKTRALYVDEVPAELVDIVKRFDADLLGYGDRFYCADFGYDGSTWKLFELNAFPGLATTDTDGMAADEYLNLLAENLVKSARGGNI